MRHPPALTAAERAYAVLRREVESTLHAGRLAAEAAMLESCWRVGRQIHEHVLDYADRADYGARTIRRLAADVHTSARALYRCWALGRAYDILPSAAQLTCAHYFALSRIEDATTRDALAEEAAQRGWVAKELERRATEVVDSMNGDESDAKNVATSAAPRLLQPKRGTVGLHRIVQRPGGLAIDEGFKSYVPLAPAQARHRTADEIVRHSADGGLTAAPEARPADLFTYPATHIRVIDGDTFAVTVRVPHGEMDKKLRLRGIDCPEMATAAGAAARRHVQALVSAAVEVVIAASKVDKYDRYLADVHLRLDETDRARLTAHAPDEDGWLHLNNALLVDDYAQRADSSSAGDWLP